jgi:hypothetical protein
MGWVLAFSLFCLYLGFSKEKYGSVIFGMLGGCGLIVLGLGIMEGITFVGWISTGVSTYILSAESVNGIGQIAVGALFSLSGIVLIVMSLLMSIFGDSQKEHGDITGGI